MDSLFDHTAGKDENHGYVLPHGSKRHIKPSNDNPAVEMIRRKIDALYTDEPNAKTEAAQVQHPLRPRSKHQEFMYRLTTSGRPMAEIQTAWHNYYAHLPDNEKHEVWQEFYSANTKPATPYTVSKLPELSPQVATPEPMLHQPVVVHLEEPLPPQKTNRRSLGGIKKDVLKHVRVSETAQRKAKQHFQSLVFGIGVGVVVLLVFLFGLFNELVITPFIKPSSTVSAAPIILDSAAPAPSDVPEAIIPKINAQLPIIYGGQSLDEKDVQKALEDGVFHYPTTALPGQNGNAAFFGHSSNNIFNKGKFKFAFVLLKELEPGDIFYLTYEGKVYTYKVYAKKIVNPDETWVLGPAEGKTATATLITCDPPGTTLHRLVVWGEQITPDPNTNTAQAEPSPALQTQSLPGKGPNFLGRFWSWITPGD
jgi:LPXTG-site transpeptidase (sortase) family protein